MQIKRFHYSPITYTDLRPPHFWRMRKHSEVYRDSNINAIGVFYKSRIFRL
jgi:hypothetical protein